MTTLTRKQREIRQREQLILETARDMVLKDGFGKLSMERIAKAVEYSKGTIYQHFSSKEDLLVAVALETIDQRNALFERAAVFSGRARERMTAVGLAYELFMRLYPTHFQCCLLVHSDAVLSKALGKRAGSLLTKETRPMDICVGIVRDGVAAGDLDLGTLTPHTLSFGLWSLHFGTYRLMATDLPFEEMGVREPLQSVRVLAQRLLDGVGWAPLSHDWDYNTTGERVLREIFPDEAARLG